MSGNGEPYVGMTHELPRSAWLLAWSCLAGQLLLVTRSGLASSDLVIVSMVVGGLVVGWVSAGVLRARTVRLWLASVLFILALGVDLVALVDGADDLLLRVASLVTSVVQLAALVVFCRTEWFAWQRGRPPVEHGPPIGSLVTIGVVVGVLGGLAEPADDGFNVEINVAEAGPTGQLRR